jgi:hypothetical protein
MMTLLLQLLLGLHCFHSFTLHLVFVNQPDNQRATPEHQHLWRLKLDALGLGAKDTTVAKELAGAVKMYI